MSLFLHLKTVSEQDKSNAVKKLITESTPDYGFFILVALSSLMVTFGLLIGNVTVIVGAIFIAPLLSPIMSLSLGVVMSDRKLLYRSVYTMFQASILAIVLSFTATLFFKGTHLNELHIILSTIVPTVEYFFVALIAGCAVSYTISRPDLNSTIPGLAVAVALIVPLSAIAVGAAIFDWQAVINAVILYFLNIIGIALASIVIFSLMNIQNKKRVADTTIKEEEKRIEEEKEKQEEIKESEK